MIYLDAFPIVDRHEFFFGNEIGLVFVEQAQGNFPRIRDRSLIDLLQPFVDEHVDQGEIVPVRDELRIVYVLGVPSGQMVRKVFRESSGLEVRRCDAVRGCSSVKPAAAIGHKSCGHADPVFVA